MPKTRLDFLIETVIGKINKFYRDREEKIARGDIAFSELFFLDGAISAYEDILKDLKQLKEVENNED